MYFEALCLHDRSALLSEFDSSNLVKYLNQIWNLGVSKKKKNQNKQTNKTKKTNKQEQNKNEKRLWTQNKVITKTKKQNKKQKQKQKQNKTKQNKNKKQKQKQKNKNKKTCSNNQQDTYKLEKSIYSCLELSYRYSISYVWIILHATKKSAKK